jgi:hypothetical protein
MIEAPRAHERKVVMALDIHDPMLALQNALVAPLSNAGACIGADAILCYLEALTKGETPEQALAQLARLEDSMRDSLTTLIETHDDQIRRITGSDRVSPS